MKHKTTIFLIFYMGIFAQFSFSTDYSPTREITESIVVETNLVYGLGGGRDLHLDLYRPKEENENRPGIVFIHGGGWRSGTREHFERQAIFFANQGYVAACIEYRLSGEATFPAALHDSKCAVRWMRAHADTYGIDPNRIAVAGGSAGGHLAAMVALTSTKNELEGNGGYTAYSGHVQAAVCFNPVLDLRDMPNKNMVIQFLGGTHQDIPEVYEQASPIVHVHPDSPPFLILHGTADTTVPFEQAEAMHQALQNAGVHSKLIPAEGQSHAYFNQSPHYELTLKEMHEFLSKVFKMEKDRN